MGTAKRVITPEHFTVAPELLGLPLAAPGRRALAIGIDLLMIVILVKTGGFVLGLTAAFLLFRISSGDQQSGFIRKSVRATLRIVGALLLFIVIRNAWGFWERGSDDDDGDNVPALVAPLSDSASRDVDSLRAHVTALGTQNTALRRQLSEKPRGLRLLLAGAADDVGVGFGWSAVYFTAFLALWRGQTPGKKLAHVRVLRLDGKPLGWWLSFERFGGYAASFSVGLLGFVQILWDRNRQGLHDKACETIVVYD